jgi:hypothetical protein
MGRSWRNVSACVMRRWGRAYRSEIDVTLPGTDAERNSGLHTRCKDWYHLMPLNLSVE